MSPRGIHSFSLSLGPRYGQRGEKEGIIEAISQAILLCERGKDLKVVLVAVCDDDNIFRKKISECLAIMSQARGIDCDIESFCDGKDLVKSVKEGVRFDIIFLDIQMKHTDGLKAAEEIRKFDKNVLIIYVSLHSKYAIEAYSVRPFQFLVKPFKVLLLEEYFNLAIDEVLADDRSFRYADGKQGFKIPLKDILYFESKQKRVNIVLASDVRSYREKLNNIEQLLNQSGVEFWRIHQSYLVNRRHIVRTKYSEVEISNGMVLPISERRRDYIREQYLEKLDKSMVEEL